MGGAYRASYCRRKFRTMYNAVMKKVIINSKTFYLRNPDFRPSPPFCKYHNLSACLIPEYSITGVMTHIIDRAEIGISIGCAKKLCRTMILIVICNKTVYIKTSKAVITVHVFCTPCMFLKR